MLFLGFLLLLVGGKDHIHCPTASSEATLTFLEVILFKVAQEEVELNASHVLASYREKRDAAVVVA